MSPAAQQRPRRVGASCRLLPTYYYIAITNVMITIMEFGMGEDGAGGRNGCIHGSAQQQYN